MRIVGVAARKGGVGKTSTAVHLAGELTERGFRVQLADCDLQGSATHWAALGQLGFTVHPTPLENASQVSAWTKQINALTGDLVVLDSPPHMDSALGGVLGIADLVLIPCGPSGLDLVATTETVGVVRDVRGVRRGKPLALLVPNRVDLRTTSGQQIRAALKKVGEPVATMLGDRTAFSDSFNAGQWVGQYAPGSVAHLELKVLTDSVLKLLNMARTKT